MLEGMLIVKLGVTLCFSYSDSSDVLIEGAVDCICMFLFLVRIYV